MPAVEQILTGLKTIANHWRILAIFWHIYFAAILISLLAGVHISKRIAGFLLLLPLLSVGIVAWMSFNPFNGFVYAMISILLVVVSFRLPVENVRFAPLWAVVPGAVLFAFGWIYPHFLDTSSFIPYLYAAPIGLIPCATLIIVIGLILILDGLDSRTYQIILGLVGLFYGITGVFQLGVTIDVILLLGVLMILVLYMSQRGTRAHAI